MGVETNYSCITIDSLANLIPKLFFFLSRDSINTKLHTRVLFQGALEGGFSPLLEFVLPPFFRGH